jgi:hypothetical protein
MTSLIDNSIAYPFVIGCSIFGIVWGVVNVILIRRIDMKDSSHIRKAPHDTEQHLLQKENMSDAENCLNTMKKISSLIEAGAITFLK